MHFPYQLTCYILFFPASPQANNKGVLRLNLQDLKNLCEGGDPKNIKQIQITSFSKGFRGGNGLALEASAEELKAAAAARPVQNMIAAKAHNDDDGNEDVDMDQKPAAKPAPKKKKASEGTAKAKSKQPAKKGSGGAKKTAKAKKAEEKAAAKKKAVEDKAARKARLARAKERRETPIVELDWQSHLALGDLVTETVEFLKRILKHEGEKVSGKKAELLQRLRALAGEDDPVEMEDTDETESETSDSDDCKSEESGESDEAEEAMEVDEEEEYVMETSNGELYATI